MARTDYQAVKTIADFNEISDSDLQEFVEDAHIIVDERLDGRLSEERLTMIEKYLAAHLASMREQRIRQDEVGDSTKTYEGRTEMGLEFTRYGQQALVFDSTGLLSSIDPIVVDAIKASGDAAGAESGE